MLLLPHVKRQPNHSRSKVVTEPKHARLGALADGADFVGLSVQSIARSVRFYSMLGFVSQGDAWGGHIMSGGAGIFAANSAIVFFQAEPGAVDCSLSQCSCRGERAHFVFVVQDISHLDTELKESGIILELEIQGSCRIGRLWDPDDHLLMFIEACIDNE